MKKYKRKTVEFCKLITDYWKKNGDEYKLILVI